MIVTNVKQALLNQFNLQNRIAPAVFLKDVDFLTPEIWLQGECNSRVVIQAATNNNDFGGQQTLYFNRRRIEDDLREVKVPGKPGDYTRYHQVLNVLRERLGVPVWESEYLDKAQSGSTFTINVTTVSMAYMPGSSVTLQFEEE